MTEWKKYRTAKRPEERKESRMKKLIGLILAVMMLAAAFSAALAEDQGTEMYVYTENGKGLTVRSTMNTTDKNPVGAAFLCPCK